MNLVAFSAIRNLRFDEYSALERKEKYPDDNIHNYRKYTHKNTVFPREMKEVFRNASKGEKHAKQHKKQPDKPSAEQPFDG